MTSIEDPTSQQNQAPQSVANEVGSTKESNSRPHDSEKIKDPLLFNSQNDEDCDKQLPREVMEKCEARAEPKDTNRTWPDWGKESTTSDNVSVAHGLLNLLFGNISEIPLPDDATLRKEVGMIASQMAGKPFYEENKHSILPQLLLSLQIILRELKEEGLEITLEVIRKEASKCVYAFLKEQNRKISAHPEHVREIPRNWLTEHGNLYPSNEQYGEITEEMGLEKKQVATLFQNLRKRIYKNDPEFNANLKSHFCEEVTHKLREWQRGNPGKQPDKETRKSLQRENNLTKNQVVDWFNNHKEGRSRSKKRTG